ncbi:Ig domain-containing protein [Geomonas sp. Red32]|uniref:beta strand repeat-containing protein n=1 Tax=Geomonas sp. Red32 TaxID=2912856 RepID=UPI003312F8B4
MSETVLTTANVSVSTFGKLFSRSVDGQIYAQPLYLPNVTIQGTSRNVVFAATMHNSVYAFDADDPASSSPLWQVNLGTPVPATDISSSYLDITPEIGILATPVIDPATGTIYVVAKTKDTATGTYHFRLHALDAASGGEKFGGPVEITAQVRGSGDGSSGGVVTLDPLHHLNRPGLLLLNGTVYLGFGSVGDISPYHGWVLAYNAGTLQQTSVFNVTPNGSQGAIWQAGKGLAADAAGNIYLMTGNGTFDANTGGSDYGDSVLKLSTASGLSVADYFTPFNQATLSANDADLGSGGPMLIPGSNLMACMGKDGVMRLIDTLNLGKFSSTTNNDVQEFQAVPSGSIFMGGTIYWNSPGSGPSLYVWGPNDYLKQYRFTGSALQTTPVSQSTMTEFGGSSNSVPLSLSANGSLAGSGIVWASAAYQQDPNQQTVPGILRALDAGNLSAELWNSKLNAARDDVGNYAKFSPPTVANGKVYLATFSNQLHAYGLLGLTVTSSYLVAGVVGEGYSQAVAAGGGQTPYSWSVSAGTLPAGLTLNPTTGVISGTPAAAGTSTFTVTVQDAALASASRNLSIGIYAVAPTLAIDVNVSTDAATAGATITSPTVATSSGNELLVAFVGASSPGTGANTFVQGIANTGGALTWNRAVTTNAQQGTAEIWWAYASAPLTGTVTATLSQSVSSRSLTVLTFIGADLPGATAGNSLSAGAPTATLTTTRNNSWVFGTGNDWTSATARTPGSGQALIHQFVSSTTADTYWVQDQTGLTPASGTAVTINDTSPTADMFNLSLVEIRPLATAAPALAITTGALPGGSVGTPYSQAINAAGGKPPYSWSISAGTLPPGLAIDAGSGTVSGTPTAAGTSSFTVRVVDASQASATQSYSLTVASNSGLAVDVRVSTDTAAAGSAITSPTVTTAAANELLVAFVSASGPTTGTNATVTGVSNTGGALTWSRAVVTNAQRGTAEIWWAYATGALSGTVTATLNQSVSSRSLTVMTFTGAAAGADAIGAVGSGSASSGAPAATLTTTRANSWVFGTGNDWSAAVARTVGPGQSLVHQYLSTATGDTYWVQSQSAATPSAGTAVTLNDTAPSTDMYNLSLVEIRVPAGPLPLSITTASLATGTVGVPYPGQAMAATGGSPPYSWTAAGLPPGLSMTSGGSIGGTPSAAGTFAVAIQVTDSAQGSAAATLNLTVSLVPPLAIDASVSTDAPGTVRSLATPTLTTHAANELLVAFVTASAPATGTNTSVTGITNSGTPLTWSRAVITNGQRGTAEIWWAYAPSTLSGTVTASLSRNVSSGSLTVLSFTGTASGASAIGAVGSGNSLSGAPTASLVTTRANSWVFGTGNDWSAAIGRTVGANQTMVHQFLSNGTGDTYWVQSQSAATPLAGSTVTINDTAPTGDRYNLSIVEIRTR